MGTTEEATPYDWRVDAIARYESYQQARREQQLATWGPGLKERLAELFGFHVEPEYNKKYQMVLAAYDCAVFTTGANDRVKLLKICSECAKLIKSYDIGDWVGLGKALAPKSGAWEWHSCGDRTMEQQFVTALDNLLDSMGYRQEGA